MNLRAVVPAGLGAVSLLLLLGCNEQKQATPDGPRVFATRMAALLSGVLSNDQGCLRIADTLLVFPPDQHDVLVDGNTVEVTDSYDSGPRVRWQLGDNVQVSGGQIPDPRLIPHKPLPPQCGGPYFLVGGVR